MLIQYLFKIEFKLSMNLLAQVEHFIANFLFRGLNSVLKFCWDYPLGFKSFESNYICSDPNDRFGS